MKKNDLIGIKKGAGDWLYCSVTKFDGAQLDAFVINGNWNFAMNVRTGEAWWDSPMGKCTAVLRIAYTGPFPDDVKDDYNAAIEFMEAQGKRWKLPRWWFSFRFTVTETTERLRRACEAFGDVWYPERAAVKAKALYDDSIPF